jgi:amino acid transporter
MSEPVSTPPTTSESSSGGRMVAETELKAGALGLPGVLMQAIADVGPAVGVFFTLGFIASYAGAATPLAVLIASCIILMVAISLAELARHLPSAGGYYTYISHTLGPRFGFITGWLMFLFYPLATFAAQVFMCYLFHDELKASSLGWDIPWWILFLVMIGSASFLIYRGISISAKVVLALGLAECAIVFILSVWGFFDTGPGGISITQPFNPSSTTSHGLFFGVVFSVFAISGWEAIVPIAEETEEPRKNIPRALIFSVLIIGGLTTISMWGLLTGWGRNDIDGLLNSSQLPVFTLAQNFWGPLWWIVVITLINSVWAICIGVMNTSTRMWFAMARSGSLPHGLAKLHPTYKTPVNALALQLVVTLGLGLVLGSVWKGNDVFAVAGLLFTLVLSWMFVWGNVGVIRYFLTERRSEFNVLLHAVFPVVSSAALVFVCVQTFTNPSPAGRGGYALPIFVVWGVIGVVVLIVMRIRGREDWLLRAGRAAHERPETASEVEEHPAFL